MYGEDGKRTLVGFAGFAGMHRHGMSNPYTITDGRLESSFDDGSTFSSRLFKLGDRFLGAKSDEAGYCNYEVIAAK